MGPAQSDHVERWDHHHNATTTTTTTTTPGGPTGGARAFGEWADGERRFRTQIAVAGTGVDRSDAIASVPVDFAALLAGQGETAALAADSLHLVRVNALGTSIAVAQPVQFVASAPGSSSGDVLVMVPGALAASGVAHFDLYFDTTDHASTPVPVATRVSVRSATDEGLDTLEVTTPAATYHFDTAGGGFSSLVDADGNDWVGYSAAPRATGEFRGIPNLISPEGAFHPGATGVVTTLVENGPLRAAFAAVTADGAWAARWEITDAFVRLRLERAGHDYWFLYEGTPGGTFEPANDVYVRPDGTTVSADDTVPTDIAGDEWALVADQSLGRGLFVSHSGDDTAADGHAPFENAMVITAFGRASPNATPLMSAAPADFTFGLVDTVTAAGAADAVNASRVDPSATRGRTERNGQGERVSFSVLSREAGDLPLPPPGSTTEQVGLILADLDGDNDDDVVVVGRVGPNSLQWYRRDTSGNWTVSVIEPDDLPVDPNGMFGDVDGDGDLDLIVGASKLSNEIWWWENPAPNFTGGRWIRREAIGSGALKHHDLGFGDVDGDGAPELVYWTQGLPRDPADELWVADVPADPTQPGEWSSRLVHDSNPRREGLKLVDIDVDGVLDILVGGSWFRFNGETYVEEVIASSTEVRVAAAQLVPGGRPEIVLSAGDVVGDLTFHEWIDGAWTSRSLLTGLAPLDGTWRHGHSLDIADIDLDGHLDVFTAEMVLPDVDDSGKQEARAVIFYGDGTGSFAPDVLSRGLDHHESALADVDGDGDADLIRKSFNVGAPFRGFDVMINPTVRPNPRLAKWAKHVIDVKPDRATFVHAADADNDGDDDLFAGAWWYENTGSIGSGWIRRVIGDPLRDVLLVDDLDGDGDVDVFGTQAPVGSGPLTRVFAWAQNDGAGNFSTYTNIDAGTNSFVQGVETVRFAPDGPLELWISWNERTNGVQRFVIPDDPTSGRWTLETVFAVSQGEEIDFADVDGDTDLDVLLGHYWVENDPGGAGWTPHILHEPTECCYAENITDLPLPDRVVPADVDADGDVDVVVSHEYDPMNRVTWYENPGSEPRGLWIEHVIGVGATPIHSLDVADIDGDGDVDVVAGEHRLVDEGIDQGRAWVFENLGGGLRWIAHEIDDTDAHHDGTQLADLDNDGDLDVFSVGWLHDRVLVYENVGGTDTLAPDVFRLQVAAAETAATVSFESDEPAAASVRASTVGAESVVVSAPGRDIVHAIVIDGLTCASRYELQITVTDARGRAATVDGGRFVTRDCVPGE